jgi:CDP-2,3-bis-(O-geranylgeranyl)-sn-glycerol synthase
MQNVLLALWFFLPAGVANVSPILSNKFPVLHRWKTPLDFGKSFRGKRIFGDNKTWRGLLVGVLMATLTIWIQQRIWWHSSLTSDFFDAAGKLMHFGHSNFWLLGTFMGLGALLGDAGESFLKRQLNKPSGESWFPFDQVDYIVGGLLFSLPFVRLTWNGYALVIVLWTGIHLIASYLGYLLKLKDKPI